MNSDLIIQPKTILFLRNLMDQHSDIGIATPRILNEDGTVQSLNRRHPTILDLFLRRFLPNPLRPFFQNRLDYYAMSEVINEDISDIQVVSGSFMFCRTDLLKSLGGFDSGYFMYFEDIELSRRVQRTHRTVHCSQVSVTHLWQRSAHKKWIYSYYFVKSAFRYFNEWGYRLY